MASIAKRPDGQYRARYRDASGREYARHFKRKVDAQRWLDERTAALVTGTHVDPKTSRTTLAAWCDRWLEGYAGRRPNTVRQAGVHIRTIKASSFANYPIGDVKPSDVKGWTAALKASGKADSTVYATYRRLAQIMGDAVLDGLIPRSPCSRKVSPGQPEQRPILASTAQVWALFDAMPDHLRPAVLLGAFAGLRTGEAAGLRVSDVDFIRGRIVPEVQYPAEPLKTDESKTPVPIPDELSLMLSAYVKRYGGSRRAHGPVRRG